MRSLLNYERSIFTTKEEVIDWLELYKISDYIIRPDLAVNCHGAVILHEYPEETLPVRFGIVAGDFDIGYSNLITLRGCPNTVGHRFSANKTAITNTDFCPNRIGCLIYAGADFSDNLGLTSICGLNATISYCKNYVDFSGCINIKSGGICTLCIDNLAWTYTTANMEMHQPMYMINTYQKRRDDIFECQNELISAGYEAYAQL